MDSIANFLTQIKNAQAVKKETVKIPFSKTRYEMAGILADQGFVEKVEKKGRDNNKSILIYLNYEDGEPKIKTMKKISKPGRRVYKGSNEIQPVRGGYGIGIISTSQGLMTDKEARKRNLGGEVLCKVW